MTHTVEIRALRVQAGEGILVQHVDGREGEPVPFRIEGENLIYSVTQSGGKVSEQRQHFSLTDDDSLSVMDFPTVERVFRRSR